MTFGRKITIFGDQQPGRWIKYFMKGNIPRCFEETENCLLPKPFYLQSKTSWRKIHKMALSAIKGVCHCNDLKAKHPDNEVKG